MSIIFDGKKEADEILSRVAKTCNTLPRKPSLAILYSKEIGMHTIFVKKKLDAGKEIGVTVDLIEIEDDATEAQYQEKIHKISRDYNGILVQLPLRENIDRYRVINAIPPDKDVEGLSLHHLGILVQQTHPIMSPVAKACLHALDKAVQQLNLEPANLNVTLIGNSYLIGRPLSLVLSRTCNSVTITNHRTHSIKDSIATSDVVISGTGVPDLITPEMIQPKTIAIDAGYESKDGRTSGDFHPDISKNSSFFTPVPGGIGPLTIAYIFDNLVTLINEYGS